MTEHVIGNVEQQIATLTLNRPAQFNALTDAMLQSAVQFIKQWSGETAIRVIVIAANGPAFCAGHDLKQMQTGHDQAAHQALFDLCSQFMVSLANAPQPVIAQVQGMATAAGCQLVAQCDLAVAASTAKFAVSGVNLGLFCATPSVPLTRNVLPKQAFEMLVTGDFIDATTAQRYGLVNHVVEPELLRAQVSALCDSIVRKPRAAIEAGKKLFYAQRHLGLSSAYQLASQTMACNMMQEQTIEGIAAFIEKRPPNWN